MKNKQTLEKYSERFDNDKSPIGNPETWGKRTIGDSKQETYEEVIHRLYGEDQQWIERSIFEKAVNWQQESTEEVMLKFMQFIVSHEELKNTTSVSPTTAKYYLEEFKKK